MNLESIENVLSGEVGFRSRQIKRALFCDLIENWNQATTLPVELRKILEKECPLKINAEIFKSKESQSVKALISLGDGLKIESVLMCHKDRNTVCVSSQIGCPLACTFCATGQMGFKRNLDKWEIVEQVLYWARWLKNRQKCLLFSDEEGNKRGRVEINFNSLPQSSPRLRGGGQRVTNIVFMGMGEPFLNYDNVIGAIKILNDKEGFNLGARHFSISTVGIVEGIEKLAQEKMEINPHAYFGSSSLDFQKSKVEPINNFNNQNSSSEIGVGVNLAISLHAANDKLRSSIMPIGKKYPLGKILRAVDEYIKRTRRRVMFEYIMIKDINDSKECARELAKIMERPLCFVNLISYNPTGVFCASSPARIKKFKEILEKAGVAVTQRYRFGEDIKAACGQLAAKEQSKEQSKKID